MGVAPAVRSWTSQPIPHPFQFRSVPILSLISTIENPWLYSYLVSRDNVRTNEIIRFAPKYPLCSLFPASSYSWLSLPLALGDVLAGSLYHQLLSTMEKELKLNISLINTVGKEKCHVHSKIKHKCLLKLFMVLNCVWNCFIYINQVDENGLHAIISEKT